MFNYFFGTIMKCWENYSHLLSCTNPNLNLVLSDKGYFYSLSPQYKYCACYMVFPVYFQN